MAAPPIRCTQRALQVGRASLLPPCTQPPLRRGGGLRHPWLERNPLTPVAKPRWREFEIAGRQSYLCVCVYICVGPLALDSTRVFKHTITTHNTSFYEPAQARRPQSKPQTPTNLSPQPNRTRLMSLELNLKFELTHKVGPMLILRSDSVDRQRKVRRIREKEGT